MTAKKKGSAKKKTAAKKAPATKRADGPVTKAWDIFNRNPKAQRKDAVEQCVQAGINISTARTQYQKWRHRSA